MPRNGYVLFVLILFAAAMFVGSAFSQEDEHAKDLRTLARIIAAVEQEYVSPEVEVDKLYEGAYRGVLSSLDPYTQFLSGSSENNEAARFTEDTQGEFGGLGIEIGLKDGILTVLSPLRGTPAWEAGILAGDMILKIESKSTEGISLDEALNKLRGKVGTDVNITIRHVNSAVDEDITLTRETIQPKSVEAEMLDPALGIGLMRVSSFNARVMKEMNEAIDDFKEQGLKALILDLRGNPGGLLQEAVEMADLFLSDGIIVSVKGRRKTFDNKYEAEPGGPLEEKQVQVVMLVDEGSASASEILAAALRDNGRALLVGARTFGKGSVQNVFDLGEGNRLKMTTARYYRPNGEPIEDRKGITPDINIPMSRDELLALRMQEREDKLRGTYHVGGLMEEDRNGAPDEAVPDPGIPANTPEDVVDEVTPNDTERRGRVVDRQLLAAYNLLRWNPAAN